MLNSTDRAGGTQLVPARTMLSNQYDLIPTQAYATVQVHAFPNWKYIALCHTVYHPYKRHSMELITL